MSKEFLEYINKLDIRVFTTISGRQLIGEAAFDENSKVILHSPLEFIKSIDPKTNIPATFLLPPIIGNKAAVKLNLSAIESETVADIRLKKLYCDQLMCNQLELMIEGLDLIEEDTESEDYFESIIKKWAAK